MSDPENEGLEDAADFENWEPDPGWEPDFEDELEPEVYDAD